MHLYAGSAEVTGIEPTVTDNGNGTYTVAYNNLPAMSGGTPVVYTIRENAITGYTADRTSVSDGEAITNTHAPDVTSVSITKAWADENNQDGLRPTAEQYRASVHL